MSDFDILKPQKYTTPYPEIDKVYYEVTVIYPFYNCFINYFNITGHNTVIDTKSKKYIIFIYDDEPCDIFAEKKIYHTVFMLHINYMTKLFKHSTCTSPSEIKIHENTLIAKYKYYLDGQLYKYNESFKKYSREIKAYLLQLRDKKISLKIYKNCGFQTSICHFPNFGSHMIRYTGHLSSLYLLDFKPIFEILTFLFGEKELCKHLSNLSYKWICDVFLPQHVNYLLKNPDPNSDTFNLRFIPLKVKQQMRKHKTVKWVISTGI
jgi:hypothetical protein